jgi:hypothetical protein
VIVKEMKPYASSAMEIKNNLLAMSTLAKHAQKRVISAEALVDGSSARRMLQMYL